MASPLPPHALAPHPSEGSVPSYPAPLELAAVPAHLQGNAIVKLYLALAPQYEAEFAEMAASDAKEDDLVAAALVASAR